MRKVYIFAFVLGLYYIDPNQGSSRDAIQVYCNIKAKQTCILPKPEKVTYHVTSKVSFFDEHTISLMCSFLLL